MGDIAIRAENLGKSYLIDHQRQPGGYKTLQEDLRALARRPLARLRGAGTTERERFWALKNVSFEVRQGEVLGIIGRNGAGKSTLLKILSRITEPSTGYADVYGRIGSLLEVGTGFHPELTGRENIYLNGTILGMTRREIDRKFDEIVAFAEVEQFLDTPVKRYSSGMYMRLAFAVAAHLEPEILVVDEVLAVGDAAFQTKCLGKMQDVAREGRTVLFVSHNMAAIRQLCTRGIYLADHQVRYDGPVANAIKSYVEQSMADDLLQVGDQSYLQVFLQDTSGARMTVWPFGSDLVIKVRFESSEPLDYPAIDLAFYSEMGNRLFALISDRLTDRLSCPGVRYFDLDFIMPNSGWACEQISIDIGIRANKHSQYMKWWQSIETLPISIRSMVPTIAPDTLLYVPCQVAVVKVIQ